MRKKPSSFPVQPVSNFPPPLTLRADWAALLLGRLKMAPGDGNVSSSELLDLRAELRACFRRMDKMTALMKPVTTQIQELKMSINQVAQSADPALELAMALQDSTQHLQKQGEWGAEKILSLENQLRARNVKFRGFQEGAEENTELRIFIANRLHGIFNFEEGVAPQ